MQTRRMSLLESGANLAVGYGVSVALSWWLLGVTPQRAAGVSVAFTAASLLRSYGLRRAFSRWGRSELMNTIVAHRPVSASKRVYAQQTPMTDDAQARKAMPIYSGVLRYFPDALLEVSRVSLAGNEQHNPGQSLHWAKEKSTDEADALVRHLLQAGEYDTDGLRHSAKAAWRGLALLQREIEAERNEAHSSRPAAGTGAPAPAREA